MHPLTVVVAALVVASLLACAFGCLYEWERGRRRRAERAREALGDLADADHATIGRLKELLAESGKAVGKANDRAQAAEAGRLKALAELDGERRGREAERKRLESDNAALRAANGRQADLIGEAREWWTEWHRRTGVE